MMVSRNPREGRWLLLIAAIFCAIYLFYYPRTYSALDEQGFLSFTMVLAEGTLRADEAGIFVVRHAIVDGHTVPAVGLGTLVLLLPAVLVHWKTTFIVMLIVHLLGFWAASRILASARMPRLYAVLYLLLPTAALYSRTIMSDLPTAVLTLFGLWAYLARPQRPLLAGALWGLTPFFRFAQIPFLVGIGLARLLKDLADWRRTGRLDFRPTLMLALGMAPGLIAWMLVNTWLYGGPLDTPVIWPLSTEYLSSHLWRYLIMLNLFYPGMLLVGVIRRSSLRAEIILGGLMTLILYSLFKHRYQGFGPAGLIIGYRFFLPLFALLLVPYAEALERLRPLLGRAARPLAWAMISLLLVMVGGQSWAHDRRLAQQERIQEEIYAATATSTLVLVDQRAREYFFDAIGKRELRYVHEIPMTAAVQAEIASALPEVYLVCLDRLDMPPDAAEGMLLEEAMRLFHSEPIRTLGQHPDQVTIHRLTGNKRP